MAPKLKGRPRGRRKILRSDSPSSHQRGDSAGSDSGTSEISACSVEKVYSKYSPLYVKPKFKQGTHVLAKRPQLRYNPRPARKLANDHSPRSAVGKRRRTTRSDSYSDSDEQSNSTKDDDKEFESSEEADFFDKVVEFHGKNLSNIPEVFWMGLRKANLLTIYSRVQKLGGYEAVNEAKMWKYLFGVDVTSRISRKKYERALLPYELYEKELAERNAGHRRGRSAGPTAGGLGTIKRESDASDDGDRKLTFAEMTEIQRQIKANHKKHDQKMHVDMSHLPVTFIVGGNRDDKVVDEKSLNRNQPHTTITVHQTTIHPQTFQMPHCVPKNKPINSLQQPFGNPIQITNQIQIQQITVQPTASTSGKQETDAHSSETTDLAKLYKRHSMAMNEYSGRDYQSKNNGRTSSSSRHGRVRGNEYKLQHPLSQSMGMHSPVTVTAMTPNEKENIPFLSGSKTTTITPILGNSNKSCARLNMDVIDLDSDNDSNGSNATPNSAMFPNMKKRKLDILRQGGLEVTAISNNYGALAGGSGSGRQASASASGEPQPTHNAPNKRERLLNPTIAAAIFDPLTPAPRPRFQSRCMFKPSERIFGNPRDQMPKNLPNNSINSIDLTVERVKHPLPFIQLPQSTTIQKASSTNHHNNMPTGVTMNLVTGQKLPDPNLQITLVSPLTHVQNVHNSQNHNIKRKSEMPTMSSSSSRRQNVNDSKFRTQSRPLHSPNMSQQQQQQQQHPLSMLNIPSYLVTNNAHPYMMQLASMTPATRTLASASSNTQPTLPSDITAIPVPMADSSGTIAANDEQAKLLSANANPFLTALDPLYLSALCSNPGLILSQTFPPELFKKFPEGLGIIPISKS